MLLSQNKPASMGRAEINFREAFDRLKRDKPERLPRGTLLSQNNVAKEAGCDPSALKKSRFPSLIAEIQRWVKEHSSDAVPSQRQVLLAKRSQRRNLRERIKEVAAQRDSLASLLVEANAKIVELIDKVSELEAKLPPVNVTHLLGR